MALPPGDEFGNESPPVAMLCMKVNQIIFFLLGPFVFVDSSFEVVVVTLTTLLAIAPLDPILFLHDPGNLTPSLDFSYFIDLLQYFVLLSLKMGLPQLSRFFFHTS